MDLQLLNKIFVVTGGASGIGREIAMTLAREGAIPVLVDRDEMQMGQTIEDIVKSGGKADSVYAELTSAEQCHSAVEEIVKRWGQVGGLVNNAGVNDGVGLEAGNPGAFMDSIGKNLLHYYMMAHYLLPELKKSKGPIVNIGSKVAVTGQGGTSGYAAANGGRNALTREWAVELLPYGIRVNSVIVAECFTPLYERWVSGFDAPEQKLEAIKRRVPFERRMTEAVEIAASVTFLLSPRSGHTTGQLLYVDGGYTHLDRAIT
jgi:L-fucose dehydrogenase